ncbi:hypothetical protein IQ241_00240 [Romeria aff. gracilis LEGE 07310]|uniref:Uncharacterized protein n=1 Tax=Vasconcelosia minhoensis LEGE 07310 TaxID=915328 RepID=A0A8J7D9V2_9CYAN|nr:hypothetical protein [Romeria gracilis]MBE9075742.1 hypothetical protein [Romeria aff. gracilis LEGE 07310]
MDLQQRLSRQRIQHIVDSYSLTADPPARAYLEALIGQYPHPLVELALAETLAQQWLTVPMVKGVSFLQRSHGRLKQWQTQPIFSAITPRQFEQITGLDARPVFGPNAGLETPIKPAGVTPQPGPD